MHSLGLLIGLETSLHISFIYCYFILEFLLVRYGEEKKPLLRKTQEGNKHGRRRSYVDDLLTFLGCTYGGLTEQGLTEHQAAIVFTIGSSIELHSL